MSTLVSMICLVCHFSSNKCKTNPSTFWALANLCFWTLLLLPLPLLPLPLLLLLLLLLAGDECVRYRVINPAGIAVRCSIPLSSTLMYKLSQVWNDVCVMAYVHVFVCVFLCVCVCMHAHACVCVCGVWCVVCVCMHTHAHAHARTRTQPQGTEFTAHSRQIFNNVIRLKLRSGWTSATAKVVALSLFLSLSHTHTQSLRYHFFVYFMQPTS